MALVVRVPMGARNSSEQVMRPFSTCGFVAPLPGPVVHEDGHIIFDPAHFDYIADDASAPDSDNLSLSSLSRFFELPRRKERVTSGGTLETVADGGLPT
jgi:hypothetical protein